MPDQIYLLKDVPTAKLPTSSILHNRPVEPPQVRMQIHGAKRVHGTWVLLCTVGCSIMLHLPLRVYVQKVVDEAGKVSYVQHLFVRVVKRTWFGPGMGRHQTTKNVLVT